MKSNKPAGGAVSWGMTGKQLHRMLLPLYKRALESGSANVLSFDLVDLDPELGQRVTVTFWRKSPRRRKR